jgi:AhpD family alkylhydroperoxidase
MTKAMANSPAVLEAYLGLTGTLARGTFDAALRERIAITVAEANGCEYCLSAHTYIGANVAGVDAAELDRAREADSEDPHIRAVLRLANAIVRGSGLVADSLIADVRAAGVTDAEIAETVGHIAVNVLTNYFNNLAGTDNDWPVTVPRTRAA